MNPHLVAATDTTGQPSADRAARLLEAMRKVFSHDLPNQMVVLQSLLQILHAEELDRLSADGREYVERLSSAARQAGIMVRFLKEMSRLQRYQAQPREIVLALLTRDLRAELSQLCPAAVIEYTWQWNIASIRADQPTLYKALLALLQERIDTARCQIDGSSRGVAGGVQLDFAVVAGKPTNGQAPQARLESLLACERLAAGGAELTIDPADSRRFSILVPG